MIIDCIADLHGHYPELEGGDLLIVAGDVGAENIGGYFKFLKWLSSQEYTRRVFIAGNHDNQLCAKDINGLTLDGRHVERTNITYLFDSGTEFEGLKIWGSPWTRTFEGMNPKCKAFTVDTEKELGKKFQAIPHDTNILITHSPPYGGLDMISFSKTEGPNHRIYKENVGSKSLINNIFNGRATLKLHVFGHVHEGYGVDKIGGISFVNASYVNERYEPVNKPIRVILL